MPIEARQYVQLDPSIEQADRDGGVSIAELQRTLSEAFAPPVTEAEFPPPQEPADAQVVRLLSRAAGYAALAVGIAALAWFVLG